MASTLIRLKARELLPPSEQEPLELKREFTIGNNSSPSFLSIKIQGSSAFTPAFEAEQIGCFTRGTTETIDMPVEDEGLVVGAISVFDLIPLLSGLERASTDEEFQHKVEIDTVRIDDRIEHVIQF